MMENLAVSGGVIEPFVSALVSGFLTTDRFGQLTVVEALAGGTLA
jgi:hypothetical protein